MNPGQRSNFGHKPRKHVLKSLMPLVTFCVIVLIVAIPSRGGELSNKYCPVTTSELAEEKFFVDYQNERIYFCCNKCKKEFLSNPEAYAAAPQADSNQTESSHHHDEGEHKHEVSVEKVVAEDHRLDTNLSHDHRTDHAESSSLVAFAGKFHPMLTHFPIALVLSALVFSILAFVLKNQTMDYVSVYSIYLAALTGLGTVILGLAAGSAASYPSFLSEYLDWHRILGISTGVLTIVTAYAGKQFLQRSSGRTVWSFRILLIVNSALVGVTGHLGAMLVFGPDHFKF